MPDAPIEIPEAFQLDSGLRDDMILSVHLTYFAPHAEYMQGQQLMLWLIGTDENDDPVEVRLSVGTDWTTADGGNTIHHPTKKKQHINKNSIYGHWLSFCFEIPELAKLLIERGQAIGSGPTDARIWSDLILHLQMRTLTFGPKIPEQERLMPTEYMGLVTDLPPTPGAMLQEATHAVDEMVATPDTISPAELVHAARAQVEAQVEATLSNGSPLFVRAIGLAKAAPDFNTFVTTALADPEILADEELAIQCADQSIIWDSTHSG